MDMLPILFSVFTSTGSLCSFKRQAQGAESVPGDFFKFTAENIEALQLRKKGFHLLLSQPLFERKKEELH